MPSDQLPPLPPHLDPRGRRASRHVGVGRERHVAVKQISLYASKAIATALSLALLIGTGVYWWQYRQFRSGLETVSIQQAKNSKLGGNDIDGKDQNILLVGNDDRTGMTNAEVKALGVGRDGGSMATDVMMILHVPADGKKATVISLPRDTYVAIPGNGKDKLNAAYIDGYNNTAGSKRQKQAAGINLLIETVQNLTGLSIDHFALIGFLGFYRISEAVGPITVNMCEDVSDPFEDGHGSGFHAHKGLNTLKGAQALAFVRQRYNYPDGMGDLDRVKRAQYFLTAAFRKVASAGGLLKLNSLFNAVKSSIVLDDKLDPLKLGAQMQALAANNIRSETIHVQGFANVNGQSVVVVDPARVKADINQWIGTADTALANAKPVAPSTVTVSVLNAGTGENGVATANGKTLQQIGFKLGAISDAPTTVNATTIEYAPGMESAAKTLSQYVPGAALVQANVKVLTLALGPDGVRVKAPAAPSSGTPTPTPSPSSTTNTKPIDAKCIS